MAEKAEAHPEIAQLKQTLRLMTIGRLLVALFLVGSTVLSGLVPEEPLSQATSLEAVLLGAAAAILLLTITYGVLLRRLSERIALRRLGYVQITGDTVFAAVLVLVTGGTNSGFTFVFSLTIIMGAVVLLRRGAFVAATLSAGLLLVIGLTEIGALSALPIVDELRRQWLNPLGTPLLAAPPAPIGTMASNVFNNALAFYAIAFLAGQLAVKVRRNEAQLAQSHARLEELQALHQNIIASLQSGLMTLTEAGEVGFFNDHATMLLEGVAAPAVAHPIAEILPELVPHLNEQQAPGRPHRFVTTHAAADGRRYFGWSCAPLRDSRGAPFGHVLVFQDITERRQMSERVKHAERLGTIGKVAATVAHEIRNPLASISGSIQLLASNLELAEDDRRLMDIVRREVDSLNSWIDGLLSLTRQASAELATIRLLPIVEDAIAVFANDERCEGVSFEVRGDDQALVYGDPTRIKQVLWNILANGVQAMPQGGKMTIETAEEERRNGRYATLRISDTGVGMSPETLKRVFEPFYTTRSDGTGLGMALVYRIVNDHDGQIEVESEPGRGTSFLIALPSEPIR